MHDEQYYSLKRFTTVDDIAMDALVMDESSSLLWFSFRAKVGTNFDPGANHSSGKHDVVFSLSCHPLKFILIVTIHLVPQTLTTLLVCTPLLLSCLVQPACFCGNTMYSGTD